ncbi:type I-G CRISPR-associated RAMP protein Csb1/Cas7g [Gimesia panareensis]|uniref:type I-G CRISPR-associated RAMP protein Csb1/Cas7g n=1 Tax=Gimesia panareensis TaxID=2527978 RepID=UPI0011898ABE|nr:type I-U CRISPR-associated RAMP protein Csb1/Cas7u [Gimesia panareensis]QDU52218.1 CRISPR-associated protein (Cas_GSU0053) [Gimesia panareensis]
MTDEEKAEPNKLTTELLDSWATDPKGPVALHLKQRLLAVEGVDGEQQIIYPPTYADIGYNIDRLADGTRVALIDSVGSQANRLEPIFKSASGFADLVPQIDIVLRKEGCGECTECKKAKPKVDKCENPWKEKRSLFDLAHRAADAVVQSSPTLLPKMAEAFKTMRKKGDASLLCTIAPTSLLFGCWDSRGGSGEKRPRLVRAIIRAWDVDELHAAAQFNSIWKAFDEEQKAELTAESKKKGKAKLSDKGFNDAPAVFRKVSQRAQSSMPEFRSTGPNPDRRVLGGIVARGPIQRDVTINLVALRGLNGGAQTDALRKYLLALSILSGTVDIELFLREGCHLRYADDADQWYAVPRRGKNAPVDLVSEDARKTVRGYAEEHSKPFNQAWEKLKLGNEHEFDLKTAKELLGKSTDEEEETGS